MFYFLSSIGVLGLPSICIGSLSLRAVDRAFPRACPWALPTAERILRYFCELLMRVQPWIRAEIDFPSEFQRPSRPGERGCLIVSNHRSHLDAFYLLSEVAGLRLLAKRTLFRVPFLGLVMWGTRQIPVKRGRLDDFARAIDTIRSGLERGERIHVFPEMTRCPAGTEGTQEFLSAPFHAALQAGARILPVVFSGTDQAWPKGGGLHPGLKIRMKALPLVDPRTASNEGERALTADALRSRVRDLITEELRRMQSGARA